jgi:hypothetical protein
LIEAVEQYERVGTRLDDPSRKVGHRREVGAELDRDRQPDGLPHIGDDGELLVLHVGGRPARVGGDGVEVQLDGVGAGLGETSGVADPSAPARGVEACDHRNADCRLQLGDPCEVTLGGIRDRVDRREVVERLREVLGARFEGAVQLDLLLEDLLLEQRRHHDGGGSRIHDPADRVDVVVEGTGRRDDWRLEFQAEIRRREIGGHPTLSSWLSYR